MAHHYNISKRSSERKPNTAGLGGELRLDARVLRLLSDSLSLLVFYADTHERCTFTNRAFDHWVGANPTEIPGAALKDVLGSQLYKALARRFRAALSGRRQKFDKTVPPPLAGPFATSRQVQMECIPDTGANGVTVGFVALINDVTESKQIDEAREKVISLLGHDLRSPLNVISMSSSYLLTASGLDERQRTATQMIDKSVKRMGGMISNVIDFARTRLGHGIGVHAEAVSMQEVCENVLTEVQRGFPERCVNISYDQDVVGLWDEGRIHQAVYNLVSNALEHGEDPIDIKVNSSRNHVSVSINNQGEPLSNERQAQIFEPFAARSKGLGLGLFVANEIVQAHGGRIELQSDEASGTTFMMRLPRHAIHRKRKQGKNEP